MRMRYRGLHRCNNDEPRSRVQLFAVWCSCPSVVRMRLANNFLRSTTTWHRYASSCYSIQPSESAMQYNVSMGLHPLITRPTRITCQSKTLIDNIFTSDITSHIQSGLLINDTSDHLPIFQMIDIGIDGNTNNSVYNKKRIVTDRNSCEIISELEKTEWDEILNSDYVNVSYEIFVNKLTDIYRKKCPIVT